MNCFICGSPEPVINNPGAMPEVHCPICGQYKITIQALAAKLLDRAADRKHLLVALVRQSSESGKPLTITTENFPQLLSSIPTFSTPLDNINRVLLLIGKRQIRADEFVKFNFRVDYPLVFARDAQEFQYFAETLRSQGLIENNPEGVINSEGFGLRLTPSGWQSVTEIQRNQQDSNQAFVAMWYNPCTEAYREATFRALEYCGYKPLIVAQQEFNGFIMDQVIAIIKQSRLLVADFTCRKEQDDAKQKVGQGVRGGVYWEAGMAYGLGKPVIHTCQDDEESKRRIHFDVDQYNTIFWKPEQLKDGIRDLSVSIDNPNYAERLALRILATIGRAR